MKVSPGLAKLAGMRRNPMYFKRVDLVNKEGIVFRTEYVPKDKSYIKCPVQTFAEETLEHAKKLQEEYKK